jgi:hypothetical protein
MFAQSVKLSDALQFKDGTLMMPKRAYYKVYLKYSIWPEIYDDAPPYSFPTEESAVLFAKSNVSRMITKATVISPNGKFIVNFDHPS